MAPSDPAEGDFDAVVVGSGAGGGAAAFGLTRAGLRTCVLEKGPHYRDEDFFHDELAVTRRSFFVPSVFEEPTWWRRTAAPRSRPPTAGSRAASAAARST